MRGRKASTFTALRTGGGHVFGHRLFSPSEVAQDPNALALICTPTISTYNEISSSCESLRIKHCHIDKIIFGQHKDELRRVFDIFSDELSRDIYFHIMKCRVIPCLPDENYVSWDSYFVNPAFRAMSQNDVVIDCGAFVGDTIEKFIWQHDGYAKKIIGFEPDEHNFAALARRTARLKAEWNIRDEALSIYPYGLSDISSVQYVHRDQATGIGSTIVREADSSTQEVRTVSLDEFLDGEKVTFIKADIESYEYRMIKGAEKTITEYRPRLGICIYHNATDFYSIPLLLKELVPEYKFMLRHHAAELADSVLYAW